MCKAAASPWHWLLTFGRAQSVTFQSLSHASYTGTVLARSGLAIIRLGPALSILRVYTVPSSWSLLHMHTRTRYSSTHWVCVCVARAAAAGRPPRPCCMVLTDYRLGCNWRRGSALIWVVVLSVGRFLILLTTTLSSFGSLLLYRPQCQSTESAAAHVSLSVTGCSFRCQAACKGLSAETGLKMNCVETSTAAEYPFDLSRQR